MQAVNTRCCRNQASSPAIPERRQGFYARAAHAALVFFAVTTPSLPTQGRGSRPALSKIVVNVSVERWENSPDVFSLRDELNPLTVQLVDYLTPLLSEE